MDSGSWIRKLREERFLKAAELERLSRVIAEATGNPDFYVSHGTLADIEAGGVPSIHKLFSLSCFLRVSYDNLLHVFGVNLQDAVQFAPATDPSETALIPAGVREDRPFPFRLNFSSRFAQDETSLLAPNPEEWPGLPAGPFNLDVQRYHYAIVGLKDDTMADLLPPGSLVEVDTEQIVPQTFAWTTLRTRPIFLVSHANRYTCCWCQEERGELILMPHPLSQQPIRCYKTPRDATVVGRVVAAWVSFVEAEPQRSQTSLLTDAT
jgi:transcriptional regulator with XRE-family HTH domain